MTTATETTGNAEPARTIVLVHGAFADGSVWRKVTSILQKAGLDVIAVQNPLESLEGDVAFTRRAIKRATGPVVLVGHSWGGVVITEAGADEKVRSLVYVAAFAPEVGQSLSKSAADYDKPVGIKAFEPDDEGYITLPADAVAAYLAPDLDAEEAALITTSQGALNGAVLAAPVSHAAWKEKPVYYALSTQDHMMPVALQRDLVKKMNATAIELDGSHALMLSKPEAVAQLIIEAAT